MKITGCLYVFIFYLGINTQASPSIYFFQQEDTIDNQEQFGMRLRALPPEDSPVYAPVMVQEGPGNESTVVRLDDGTLKIFFINRPGSADKLMYITSRDGGFTWDEPAIAFDLPGQAYYANQVVLGKDGELHCVFHLFDKGENGYRGRHLNLWYCKTANQQQSWTTPRKIFDGYVGALRGFIQLNNGRLLLAFAKAVPERGQQPPPGTIDYGWNDIISMFSDDAGNTWQLSENNIKIALDKPNTTRYGGIEPSIIELNDNSIWMLIRTRLGYLYESYSYDGGISWESPKPTPFISSDSPATTLRLSDGRIVLFWCSNQRWDDPRSYAIGGREVLHAAISADEGKTWKGFREVLVIPPLEIVGGDRGSSYPSAVETSDGRIILVAGQGEGQRAIVLLDPAWLEETAVTDNFSEGLVQWTLFGADSTTHLEKMSDRGNQQALLIRKSPAHIHHDTEAVWNFPMAASGELEMEVVKNLDSKGIHFTLSDHFSIAGDTAASQHAVVSYTLDDFRDNDLWKRGKAKIAITISWNTQEQKAMFYGNGKLLAVFPFQRRPHFGLNYLRSGISGEKEDTSGYYLKSVHFTSYEKPKTRP